MALTPVDRKILQRCLQHEVNAWNDFVDRFLGLIYHVIHYTAYLRSQPLSPEEVEDVAQEILLTIVADDYAVLRRFKGNSSLATYLTVIARRTAVNELMQRVQASGVVKVSDALDRMPAARSGIGSEIENTELMQKMLRKLSRRERELARLRFFEQRSYEEISQALGIPVNSVGPMLSRLKEKIAGPDGRPTPTSK